MTSLEGIDKVSADRVAGSRAIFKGHFNSFALAAAFSMALAGAWVLSGAAPRAVEGANWIVREPEAAPVQRVADAPAPSPYFATPQLRIETGMHSALPRGLSVDAKGQIAVSAGDDGTVRVWALPSGKGGALELLDVLRGPLGAGNAGKLYSVAISPDSRTIAAGGALGSQATGYSILFIDRISGRVTLTIREPDVATALAFSPDGTRLAVGLSFLGLKVYQTRDGRTLRDDIDYAAAIYGLVFDGAGRLAASAFDQKVRLYDASGAKIATSPATDGEFPFRLAFAPDGSRLALGYANCFDEKCPNAITLYDTSPNSLKRLRAISPSTPGDSGGGSWLSSVAWSGDGRSLYAGGGFRPASDPGNRVVVRFDAQKSFPTQIVSDLRFDAPVIGLVPLPAGVLALSADPVLGALSNDGEVLFRRGDGARDYRPFTAMENAGWFRVSRDGLQIDIPAYPQNDQPPLRFDLPNRRLTVAKGPDPQLAGACDFETRKPAAGPHCPKSPGYRVVNWMETTQPTLRRDKGGAVTLDKDQDDLSRSLAVAPDGKRFVLGTSSSLLLYTVPDPLPLRMAAPGVAWRVNITPDERLLVAAFDDGTVRWYSLEKGQELTELLALYVAEPLPGSQARRWIVWTPSGYYDASPGGEDLLGWHLNRGARQSALFYPSGRFRDLFRRPDVIDAVLRTRTVPPPPPTEAFNTLIPPVLRILDLRQSGSANARLSYRLDWPAESKRRIASLNGSVNGVTTRIEGAQLPSGQDTGTIDLFVPEGAGAREISLSATTPDTGVSEPAIRRVSRLAPSPGAGPGILHALLIGVADY